MKQEVQRRNLLVTNENGLSGGYLDEMNFDAMAGRNKLIL